VVSLCFGLIFFTFCFSLLNSNSLALKDNSGSIAMLQHKDNDGGPDRRRGITLVWHRDDGSGRRRGGTMTSNEQRREDGGTTVSGSMNGSMRTVVWQAVGW
jgi:hypothetical protein